VNCDSHRIYIYKNRIYHGARYSENVPSHPFVVNTIAIAAREEPSRVRALGAISEPASLLVSRGRHWRATPVPAMLFGVRWRI
jgi:hypothetical protein